MTASRNIVVAILFLVSFTLAGQDNTSGSIYRTDSGYVSFVSKAPLEIISAESNQLKGVVDHTGRSFAFRVKVTTLEGFNSPLQREHFNENYLESERFPDATFNGVIIEDAIPGEDWITVRARGSFQVHGITRERIIPCKIRIKNGKLQIHSRFTVLLNDHDIPIPKLVSEKIADEIEVTVRGTLTPMQPENEK
ncbi:MAG: hypothetical protein Kow00127_16330 [Bacteroidales bacterium]